MQFFVRKIQLWRRRKIRHPEEKRRKNGQAPILRHPVCAKMDGPILLNVPLDGWTKLLCTGAPLGACVLESNVRQNPLYTLAALREGSYMIGMKNQFNAHDLPGL